MAESEPGITITRVFDAPRERVWREWTEPERFADWFGGPEADIPLSTVSMDLREGGGWRAIMYFGSARREIRWWGEYQEIVEPERLVFTITDQPDPERMALVIVVLTDLGDGRTEMHMEQHDDMTPEQHRAATTGWGKFFDRMDERLAAEAQSGG